MSLIRSFGRLLLHTLGLGVVLFLGSVIAKVLSEIPGLHWGARNSFLFLLTVPFPVHLLCSGVAGFLATRKLRHTEAKWIFVFPTAVFLFAFVSMIRRTGSVLTGTDWHLPFDFFFDREPWNSGFEAWQTTLGFTLPLLASLAYAGGSWLALRVKLEKDTSALFDTTTGAHLEP